MAEHKTKLADINGSFNSTIGMLEQRAGAISDVQGQAKKGAELKVEADTSALDKAEKQIENVQKKAKSVE